MKPLIKSFGYAIKGLYHSFAKEQNFRIEIICTILVCAFGFAFDINKVEWLIIIIHIAIVLMAELINTAIENICNMVQKEIHPTIKIIKDVSAAAVVIPSVSAFISGLIIFTPYLIKFIKS